jgi:hypothetical protein
MVHVSRVALFDRLHEAWQLAPVDGGQLAAADGPAREQGKPRAQHRGLELVEPAVRSGLVVLISCALPAVAKALDAFGDRRV